MKKKFFGVFSITIIALLVCAVLTACTLSDFLKLSHVDALTFNAAEGVTSETVVNYDATKELAAMGVTDASSEMVQSAAATVYTGVTSEAEQAYLAQYETADGWSKVGTYEGKEIFSN